MHVITGATGHVGGGISDILLSGGRRIRVIGRSAARLEALVKKGAEAFPGDMADPDFLIKAFAGAEAAFTMIPPDPRAENQREYQNRITDGIVAAIRNSGVKYVVTLSSVGVDLPDLNAPGAGLRNLEQRLNEIPGLNVVHLRPSFFMENLYNSIEMIRRGMIGMAFEGDIKLPFIATRDIASVGAQYLLRLEFKGSTVRTLLGERDISMKEITKIIGEAIGNPTLKYVQLSYQDLNKAMIESGLSTDFAQSYVSMSRAVNERKLDQVIKRTAESTTRTSFEEFAKSLAAAVRKAA